MARVVVLHFKFEASWTCCLLQACVSPFHMGRCREARLGGIKWEEMLAAKPHEDPPDRVGYVPLKPLQNLKAAQGA